jgi:hypothetical protein
LRGIRGRSWKSSRSVITNPIAAVAGQDDAVSIQRNLGRTIAGKHYLLAVWCHDVGRKFTQQVLWAFMNRSQDG